MRQASVPLIAAGMLLSGCVSGGPPPQAALPSPPPSASAAASGLDSVLGGSERTLLALFGTPGLDLSEGDGRKLQFIGSVCVLDAYLYPPRDGDGEPVVTHVDARLPDGRDIDRSSCVAALSQRAVAH